MTIRPMLHLEFAAALETIGWSQSRAAEELGHLAVTVRRWSTGRGPVPDYVAEWLRPLAAEIAEVHKRHPVPARAAGV